MTIAKEVLVAELVSRLGQCGGVLVTLKVDGSLDDAIAVGRTPAVERRALYLATEIIVRADEPVCRICGCSQFDACEGGCAWALPDLCTVCFERGIADE